MEKTYQALLDYTDAEKYWPMDAISLWKKP